MKENYQRLKKSFHIYLSLGIVLIVLGISGIVAKQYILSIFMIIVGAATTFYGFIIIPRKIKIIISSMKKTCPICNKKIVSTKEDIEYFINGEAINELTIDVLGDKTKRETKYYICQNCSFCLVEMKLYIYKPKTNSWKEIKSKTNVDFDYHNQY